MVLGTESLRDRGHYCSISPCISTRVCIKTLCVFCQVSLKVLNTRPELEVTPDEEEVSVRLSILPIRLNIDQVQILHNVHVYIHCMYCLNMNGYACDMFYLLAGCILFFV